MISWDVLARAVIADWEGDYIAALRANAERARDALPGSGEVGVRADVSCDGIVERLAPPETKRATVDHLLAAVGVHELAAYRELCVCSRSAVDDLRTAGVLAQLRQFARLLSLAHLPTLASFYLRFAEQVLGERDARNDLVEVLCDADAGNQLPRDLFQSDGQPVQDELAVYATARTLISKGAADTAFGLVGERCGGGKRPNPDALSDRMALVYAELTAEIGELGEPAERIARSRSLTACGPDAARVSATLAFRFAARESSLPVEAIRTFVTGYGDEYRFWRAVTARPSMDQPWFPVAMGMLVAEMTALPHVSDCWRVLEYVATPSTDESEVIEHLRRHSTL